MSHPSYRASARMLPARSRGVMALGFAAALFGALIAAPKPAAAAERVVPFAQAGDLRPGTVVISARQRALYYVLDNARAIRYPIAVPKRGKGKRSAMRGLGKRQPRLVS